MENLTDCEQVVMKSVWDAKKDTSLQEVMRYLEEKFHKDWKRQTVSTFLLHLIEKGYLRSYRVGRVFYYVPLVDEEVYKRDQASKFVNFWFDGMASGMVASLSDQQGLSSKDIECLKALAAELD